jgi:ammonium transporter Rh
LCRVICLEILKGNDDGGAITIHVFGAFFGLACSSFFQLDKAIALSAEKDIKKKVTIGNYQSEYIAMIGTLFLWVFWPSFNGALAISE